MVAPRANRTPETDAKVCAGIIATLALPAILTLRSVRVPQSLVPLALDPTPLGYTRSLSLFAVPILVLPENSAWRPAASRAKPLILQGLAPRTFPKRAELGKVLGSPLRRSPRQKCQSARGCTQMAPHSSFSGVGPGMAVTFQYIHPV